MLLYDKNNTMKRMKKKQTGEDGPKEIKEVKRGHLKKKNQYFMKQVRTFILTNEPKLTYYKNETEYKGEVILSRQVYARRSGRDRFEIVTPQRTYFLIECSAGESD